MTSIGKRSNEIATTADRTAELAQELTSVGDDLEKRISHFKTTCEIDGGTIARGGECEDPVPSLTEEASLEIPGLKAEARLLSE